MVLFYCHIYLSPTNTVYTHPTSSGNKHIPSGGSAGQILRWSSDGTATWGNDNNTTYGTGTSSASGLTKLYGGTGSATDGTMTQSAITSALNGKVNTTQSTPVHIVGIELDDKGAYIYSSNGNVMFRYRTSSNAEYSYSDLITITSNIKTLNTQVSSLNASIVKIKVVDDSCVTSEDLSTMSGEKGRVFGTYKFFGCTGGSPIKSAIEEIKKSGGHVLGGFIIRGPLTDSNWSQNKSIANGIIICTNAYDNCPYQVSIQSDGYQTMRVSIGILYTIG